MTKGPGYNFFPFFFLLFCFLFSKVKWMDDDFLEQHIDQDDFDHSFNFKQKMKKKKM